MYTRPILANVIKDEEGNKDFGAHDRAYSFDEEGNLIEEIIEKPIGCIESVWFEEDPAQGVTRAVVDGCLWSDYAKDALDILNDRGQVDCSVELSIKAMRFEEDMLILDDYFVMGLTLLGKNFEPGMAGSTANIKEFVTDSQKKDEDDQELLDTVEQEESERIANDEPAKIAEVPEKEAKPKAKTSKAKAAPTPEKEPQEKAEPEKEQEPETKESEQEAKTEPEKETVLTNSLILEGANLVLTCDDKGEFLYCYSYSGNAESPIQGEAKEVCLVDMDAMARFARDGKELAAFKAGKSRAEKKAILDDPLYASIRNSEAFRQIESELDSLSLEQIDHKALAAFAQSKKEEKVESPFSLKSFGSENVRPVKDAYLEERYGKIFNK